jgi:hypothetical protein
MRNRYRNAVLICLFVALSLAIHLIGIDLPWRGPRDSVGAYISHNADLLIKNGPALTKAVPVLSAGPLTPENYILVPTHPPLTTFWVMGFRALLGTDEWVSRLAAVFLSLGIIIFTYLISGIIMEPRGSMIVLLSAVFLPMEAYWGRLPSEPLCAMAMVTVAVFFYLKYRECGKGLFAAGFFFFHFLGCMSDWIAYMLPPALLLYELIISRKKVVLPLCAIGLNFLYFALFIVQVFWAGGSDAIATLLSIGGARTGFVSEAFSYTALVTTLAKWILLYFTIPLAVIALLWAYRATRIIRSSTAGDKQTRHAFLAPLIFLLVFCLYLVILPNHVLPHEFTLHPLTPFFALSAGLIFSRAPDRPTLRFVWMIALVLVMIQLALVLDRRFSHQNGYPVDYPLAVEIASITSPQERIITHLTLNESYYPYYCDRYIAMDVNSITDFLAVVSPGKYTTFLAIDLDALLSSEPQIKGGARGFTELNHLRIDPALLAYLRDNYPYRKVSYFLEFDLTGRTGP